MTEWYDDGAFRIEQKRYGLWESYDKDGKGIVTSLTEEDCVRASRFVLKGRIDGWNNGESVVKSENSFVGGKL